MVQRGTNGFALLLMRNIQGVGLNASFDAQFFDVVGHTIGGEYFDVLYENHGIDGCSLYRLTGIGWEAESATITFLDAGDVFIHIGAVALQAEEYFVQQGSTAPSYLLYDFPDGQDNFSDKL